MKIGFMKNYLPEKLSFKQQLVTVFSIGIICLTLISSLFISSMSSRDVYEQLLHQGQQITLSFANRSKVALLYQSPETAREATLAVMAFPDVVSAAIYTDKHELLYREGAPNAKAAPLWPDDSLRYSETADAWSFVAPVFAAATAAETADSPFAAAPRPEHVGYVQVTVTKHTLSVLSQKILRSNVGISTGLAFLLLLVLLIITSRLTRPLRNLAELMRRSEQGETQLRAVLGGPRDIQHMEQAFNTMMDELEARERALTRARDSALGMANAKTEFAAMVSHELRTPMNGVLGMIELIRSSGLTIKQEEYLKVARDSGEALLLLIDDILDFSKIEAGKMKINPTSFNVRELIDDIVDLLSFQAKSKHLSLTADVAAEVPNHICADAGRIRQILINLVGNAIKFTQQGGVVIRVASHPGQDQSLLQFEVVDTGIGIPDNALKRIFEAFSQIDSSSTRKYSGTGLGLSICRQLAQLMGGSIDVSSEFGKGSCFTVLLPFAQTLEIAHRGSATPDQLASLRVLLIGDDNAYCQRLHDYLTARGSFARHAGDVAGARDLLRNASIQGKPYDLIIIDHIAEMAGSDLARAISRELGAMAARILLFSDTTVSAALPQYPIPIVVSARPIDREDLYRAMLDTLDAGPAAVLPVSTAMDDNRNRVESEEQLVLIAEDNRTNQLVAQGMLEQLGYRTAIVNDGAAALEFLQRQDVALILMDCYMPVLDGFGAAQKIRQMRGPLRQLPIVAMTARVGLEDREQCLAAGMDDVVTKPLSFNELARVLTPFLPLLRVPDNSPLNPVVSIGNIDGNVLDGDTFEQLRINAGAANFAKILSVFLEDTPRYLQKLEQAIADEDRVKIRDLTHAILGSARNIGATSLVDCCRKLEVAAAADAVAYLRSLQQQLSEQFQQLRQHLPNQSSTANDNQSLRTESSELQMLPPRPYILVVDDELSSRLSIVGILERDNYTIVEAENGRQALELCQVQMPDLILMDAMMPEMDGFKACQSILQLPSENYPAILIVTALHDEASVTKAFAAGATDYISKPINLLVLRKRIERLLLSHSSERHIRQLAYYDSLTDLPNRSLFVQRANDMLESARERNDKLALLFMDLDRFKQINDTLGHDAGDLLLRTAAKRLQSCVRVSDLVARQGGDEFTVMLEAIRTPDMVAKIADKICRAFNQPFTFGEQKLYVCSSIGIALFPDNGSDIGTLMKHADTAMFRAKAKGGACFQYYEFGMEAEILRKVELESELRHALDHGELVLHYQPQVHLHSGQLHGLEALVRWQHPQRGLLPPGEFIPLAEECGLINRLGEWVLSRVCTQQREWLNQGLVSAPVSVNVAYTQLVSGDLAHYVQSTLADTGIEPALLKLEFTETTLVDSNERIVTQMNALKALGVTLEIDDFGIGYSSLSYLKNLPVDALKVDRSFIKDLLEDNTSAAVVAGIIAMAHALNLQVIAEGVETQEQQLLLQQQECDIAQGYFISRPLPVADVQVWMNRFQRAQQTSGSAAL
jgi:diguanylate cyclase (GGDEF)-like protein